MLLTAAAVALLPIGLSFFRQPSGSIPAATPSVNLDTHIPRGFVLVPVDVLNYEALDSIIGRYGVVDLYSGQTAPATPILIARNVRMLRAPQNPSHFAVLVREQETGRLLSRGNSFTVIVKPSNGHGTEFVESQPKRRIIYGEVQ
jgi:hypothetical protein